LFRRLTETKYAVYMSHERRGIARGFNGDFRLNVKKFGRVKREQRMNWANVIRGPAVGCSLLVLLDGSCYNVV